tara:strand:+ start:1997 stop:2122 length:126 start_codon:yes stop_codon:yes gene_type:complete
MRFFTVLILLVLLLLNLGCGKKTSLTNYPESDFPKNYPKND